MLAYVVQVFFSRAVLLLDAPSSWLMLCVLLSTAAPPTTPPTPRVPLPVWGLCAMLLPASALLVAVLVIPVFARDWTTVAATGLAILSGFALFPLLCWLKESGRVDFGDLEFEFSHAVSTSRVARRRRRRAAVAAAAAAGAPPPAGDAASEAGSSEGGPSSGRGSPGAGDGAYTIVASGALHYPGDDVYDSDVFVDVANDGVGTRFTSASEGTAGYDAISRAASGASSGALGSGSFSALGASPPAQRSLLGLAAARGGGGRLRSAAQQEPATAGHGRDAGAGVGAGAGGAVPGGPVAPTTGLPRSLPAGGVRSFRVRVSDGDEDLDGKASSD